MADQRTLAEDRAADRRRLSSSLLAGLKRREATAWDRFVQLYNPIIYGWCRSSSLQPNDADEIVQEVFQAIDQHVAKFQRDKPGQTFHGWVWTIAKNKIYDHFRRRAGSVAAKGGTSANQRLQHVPERLPFLGQSPPSDELERRLACLAVESIRPEFGSNSWQAFWRMTVEGHTSAEIGQDLGMTKDAVRRAKFRVSHRLQQEIARLREEMDGML